jgi:hypothetical protein
MAEAKTRPNDASVEEYLASRASGDRLADCRAVLELLGRVTRQPPRMWGPSIVGFGSYRYPYASGKTGESCLTGFAIRGRDLVVYLGAEGPGQAELLSRLGKHRIGKACLYFKRLGDLDAKVLERLVSGSVAELERRHADFRDRLSPRI